MNLDLYRTSANSAYQRLTATFGISFGAAAANAALAFFAAPAAASGRLLISLMAIGVALYTTLAVANIVQEARALLSDLEADASAYRSYAQATPLGMYVTLTVITQVLILLATVWAVWS
jgi:hypothetical protein